MRLILIVTGLAVLIGCATEREQPPMIDITLDRNDNSTAKLLIDDGRAVIDVADPRGINGLTATLAEGEWPAEITVRLNLNGLEQAEIQYGNYLISTGVSSSDSQPLPLILSVTDAQGRVQSASPSAHIYYPAISQMDGGFEITLPPHFFQEKHAAFSLRWIDFYR